VQQQPLLELVQKGEIMLMLEGGQDYGPAPWVATLKLVSVSGTMGQGAVGGVIGSIAGIFGTFERGKTIQAPGTHLLYTVIIDDTFPDFITERRSSPVSARERFGNGPRFGGLTPFLQLWQCLTPYLHRFGSNSRQPVGRLQLVRPWGYQALRRQDTSLGERGMYLCGNPNRTVAL